METQAMPVLKAKNQLTNKSQWFLNQEVEGFYCGQYFHGRLTDGCRPTVDGRNVIFQVRLYVPITVYGEGRLSLEVWTTRPENTIYTVEQ